MEQEEWQPAPMDLAPAQWIWFPSERVLPNTFVLFRREITCTAAPARATGWLTADSRYRLTVNGQRVQWGPAPCDPRALDVDPMDLTPYLRAGRNVIGVEVLFYGHGDGTWATGNPGFLFRLDLTDADGGTTQIVSDPSWQTRVDRAHPLGQHAQWFLRALQEEFDARLHPWGWDTPEFTPDAAWLPAMPIGLPADKPTLCSGRISHPTGGVSQDPAQCSLRRRQIPLLREQMVAVEGLKECGRVHWLRDPADWFDMRTPGAFTIQREPVAEAVGDNGWRIPALAPDEGIFLTFALPEEMAGWPGFTIEAPEGAIVEMMLQESHDPEGPAWLDSHFFNWCRFICREGMNHFESFDYFCLRWIQLHIRNASGPVTVRGVGARRRLYPWAHEAEVKSADPQIAALIGASLNTLRNSVQEINSDGLGRERQQYSGDVGHQQHAVRYAFGETRLPRRYLRTWSEGLALDGYFMDCWPGVDRLTRVMQRQVGATEWGPLLDHGVGFIFDCWNHYRESGEREALREPYPRLTRFAAYLAGKRGADGLLPVENLGVPAVWIDHCAYRQQRHKQCAFNLYAAAMFTHALAPLARLFEDTETAAAAERWGSELLQAALVRYWNRERRLFVSNNPWIAEEGEVRLDDRALATALLFDQCPDGAVDAALQVLMETPPEMGLSYPANACWRYWALGRWGRGDVILQDLRNRWATMESVRQNNSLSEHWSARPDSTDEWSHSPLSPLFLLYQEIAGIRPTAPGFASCRIRPQLGDLPDLALTAFTPHGPIRFAAVARDDGHDITLILPPECRGELAVPQREEINLPLAGQDETLGLALYRLPSGEAINLHLRR